MKEVQFFKLKGKRKKQIGLPKFFVPNSKSFAPKRKPFVANPFFKNTRIPRSKKNKKLIWFKDYDKDKVPNFLDCRPYNKRKHMVSRVGTKRWMKEHQHLSKTEIERKHIEAIKRGEKKAAMIGGHRSKYFPTGSKFAIAEARREKLPYKKLAGHTVVYNPEKVSQREVEEFIRKQKEYRAKQRVSLEEQRKYDRETGEFLDFPEEDIKEHLREESPKHSKVLGRVSEEPEEFYEENPEYDTKKYTERFYKDKPEFVGDDYPDSTEFEEPPTEDQKESTWEKIKRVFKR